MAVGSGLSSDRLAIRRQDGGLFDAQILSVAAEFASQPLPILLQALLEVMPRSWRPIR